MSQTQPTPPANVLERAMAILGCFTEESLRLYLRDFAVLTGLDKATLLRQLGTLARNQFVHRFDDGSYAPGPALLRLGMLYRRAFDWSSRIQPVLHRVMEQTNESTAFFIRSGDERICLFRANVQRPLHYHLELGVRVPLKDGGSAARVLLAYTGDDSPASRQVRQDGYAITRSERVQELTSVSMPVFDADGAFLGTLIVIGLASRQNLDAQIAATGIVMRELQAAGFSAKAPSQIVPT